MRAPFGLYLGAFYLSLVPELGELVALHDRFPWVHGRAWIRLWPNPFGWLDAPEPIAGLLIAAALLALVLALGWHDRESAWLLLWLDVSLALFVPRMLQTYAVPFAARWLVLILAGTLPRAPIGALAAAGRADPGGGWRWPKGLRAFAWLALVAGVTVSALPPLIADPSLLGGTDWIERAIAAPGRPAAAWLTALPHWAVRGLDLSTLYSPLLFLVLAPWPRWRPWGWLALFLGQLALQVLLGTWIHGIGLLLALLLLADPGWIPARRSADAPVLFFDGTCGLCHGFVRLALAEAPGGGLRFAPIGGATFTARLDAPQRRDLPDSLVWSEAGRSPLVRSAAVRQTLAALGGAWRLLAGATRAVPSGVLDLGYDAVARVRRRLFARPETVCPFVPPPLRDRLLD